MIDRRLPYLSQCMECGASGAPVLFATGCLHCKTLDEGETISLNDGGKIRMLDAWVFPDGVDSDGATAD